jgi:hypothetical protein
MLETIDGDVGIELVGLAHERASAYVSPATLPDRQLVEPFVDVACRYGTARENVLVRAAGRPTSAELSATSLRAAATAATAPHKPDRWLLLAQSDGDRDAILGPLARLHHEVAPPSEGHFGVTHLDANAAVDTLALLAWLLTADEHALLVLTDQRVLAPRYPLHGRLPAGDGSVALRVQHGAGRLRLLATGHARWPREAFSSHELFAAHLADDLQAIRLEHPSRTPDHVVVQNLFAGVDRATPDDGLSDADFGAGDVWHRLARLLDRGVVRDGERVLLVATSAIRRVSYAVLRAVGAQEHRA